MTIKKYVNCSFQGKKKKASFVHIVIIINLFIFVANLECPFFELDLLFQGHEKAFHICARNAPNAYRIVKIPADQSNNLTATN